MESSISCGELVGYPQYIVFVKGKKAAIRQANGGTWGIGRDGIAAPGRVLAGRESISLLAFGWIDPG
ncbi:MAG: hypothetical protein ACE5FE_00885 [Acidiferrobacterales bacterium]